MVSRSHALNTCLFVVVSGFCCFQIKIHINLKNACIMIMSWPLTDGINLPCLDNQEKKSFKKNILKSRKRCQTSGWFLDNTYRSFFYSYYFVCLHIANPLCLLLLSASESSDCFWFLFMWFVFSLLAVACLSLWDLLCVHNQHYATLYTFVSNWNISVVTYR